MLIASALTSIGGCKRDLGECNLDGQTTDGRAIPGPAAFDIASRVTDGLPMYEGQALVQSTCGDGTFCHAPAAVGANRVGVPAGLNFDVALACTVPFDDCDDQSPPYADRIGRLYGNQSSINSWAEGMIQEIRAGAMPPGEAGVLAENPTPWLRKDGESLLPSIRSEEGQEIVRNWLACQSPVIARTEIATSPEDELQPCASVDDEICVYSGPQGALPAPEWSEIYWSIMFTECVACHGPPNNNDDQNPNNPFGTRIPGGADPSGAAVEALDLSGFDKTNTSDWAGDSYPAVVNASAYTGGVCATFGTLVVPGVSDNSLLLDKMRNNPPACGTVMPPPGSIAEPLIQVVEDWIDLGAPDN